MADLQNYLDKALVVLDKFGIVPHEEDPLANALKELADVDEARILAIAQTLKHMSSFNELVRDNVQDIKIADRYADITKMFDSVRDDSKKLVGQIEDGKIDLGEKTENIWMKLTRGTPHARFEKIMDLYKDVSKDTRGQLEIETTILEAYMNFRAAMGESGILATEVLQKQEKTLELAKTSLSRAEKTLAEYGGEDQVKIQRLQLNRDETFRDVSKEDRKYQLIKDVAENLKIGYNTGETLAARLSQTHAVKRQVYMRSVTFFDTNEHVFTIMDAVYTSQHGLHEATETLEAMEIGANKGLEDIAELGNELNKAALQAGYGETISPKSVQKLVDAVVYYQLESRTLIEDLRDKSEESADEIEKIVEDGKARYQTALTNYSAN